MSTIVTASASMLADEKRSSTDQWQAARSNRLTYYFPVPNLKKTKVRHLASLFHLPIAEKKDSTGICRFLWNARPRSGTGNKTSLVTSSRRGSVFVLLSPPLSELSHQSNLLFFTTRENVLAGPSSAWSSLKDGCNQRSADELSSQASYYT